MYSARLFLCAVLKKDPDEPIKSPVVRVANVLSENWRGIIGTVPLLFVPIFLTELKARPDVTVKVIWLVMFWLLLIQPVNVPVTGMVPIFAFPCLHVMSSDAVCNNFFNPTMVLLIVGGYVLMLLNDSGFDKRAILWMMVPKKSQLSPNSMIYRASLAAFFLSMFSNRLLVTSAILELVSPPLMSLQKSTAENDSKADYNAFRFILCNAIATSSSIGSIAILHTSFATLAMRAVWELHGDTPDVFNFFQYCNFALPVAAVMFLANLLYHVLLLKGWMKIPMSEDSLNAIGNELAKEKEKIPPKVTLHEKLSIIFLVLSLILYYFRWSEIMKQLGGKMGWADYQKLDKFNNPTIADATVASVFAILLHILPKSFEFTKYFKRKLNKRDMPPARPETGILYWRFVDKNTNYGYFILIGGGIALNIAVTSSGLSIDLQERGRFITDQHWSVGIGIVCLLSVVLCNIMSSVAAVIILLPFVLNMVPPNTIWEERLHLCALAVGISCSFGYALPFRYTPAYYMKKTGKVPLFQQIKYALGSVIISLTILWLALCFYADPVFIGDTRIGTTSAGVSTTKKYL